MPDPDSYLFRYFASLIEKEVGIRYKDDRNQMKNRLDQISRLADFADSNALYEHIREHGLNVRLRELIWNISGNHETGFFRDRHVFTKALHYLLKSPPYGSMIRPVRFWSAACSSGQEAYTLAMLCGEWQKEIKGRQFTILASDVSSEMLEKAEAGTYSLTELSKDQGPGSDRINEWFIKGKKEEWTANALLKSRLRFFRQNLLQPLSGDLKSEGPFDFILLRNVLIYFHEVIRKKVLIRVSELLRPGGYLLTGVTESIGIDTDQIPLKRTTVQGIPLYQRPEQD